MFNLLVSGDDQAWNGEPYPYVRSRLFEYTEDAIAGRFNDLREDQIERLRSLPAVFAYESGRQMDARVGKITSIRLRNREVVVRYQFDENIAPIPHQMLIDRRRGLDIGEWELNRTHWAVKDIDLIEFLETQGLVAAGEAAEVDAHLEELPAQAPISILPRAFRVPDEQPDPRLVSVMMPFHPNFAGMLEAVRAGCREAGLLCQNANEIWDHDEIIQDIFALIYRSRVVVCDFTTQNPNVFYEAGIAHTLGKPVIPITQNIDALPFDLRHRRALLYSTDNGGLEELRRRIAERLNRIIELD
jgi:hypothetical protein